MADNTAFINRFENREASTAIKEIFDRNITSFVTSLSDGCASSILEIGCGVGYWIRHLNEFIDERLPSRISVRLTGIDIDTDSVEYARRWSNGITRIQFDVRPSYDFSNLGQHDVVFMVDVLQHFGTTDRPSRLQQILEATVKNDGKLVVIDKELLTYFGIKSTVLKALRIASRLTWTAKYSSFNRLRKQLQSRGFPTSVNANQHFRALVVENRC